MQVIGYLVYGLLLLPLSLIPMPVLYALSSGLSILVFNIIGYRKAVIRTNLQKSFPNKSIKELQAIEKAFHRNFCDVFFAENIKGLSPFKGYLKRMLTFSNLEVMEKLYAEKRGVIISAGHFGNWELLAHLQTSPRFKHQIMAVYKVQSVIANLLLKLSRGKSGAKLVPMEAVKRSFDASRNHLNAYLFIGDQSPANPKMAHWTTFLNQETGVVVGSEKLAKIYDYAVVYTEIRREKRGGYQVDFQLVSDNPKETETGEITTKCTRLLEQSIIKNPDNWLWSHRRWKHSNPNKK